jgi:hypothetical protein
MAQAPPLPPEWDHLLRAAARAVEANGYSLDGLKRLTVTVQVPGWPKFTLNGLPVQKETTPVEEPVHPAGISPNWRWCSEVELKVIAALRDGKMKSASELATALGIECTSDFRALLRNLGERAIIEITSRGNRLLS